MFQNNVDWEATKSIYESTNSILDDGRIELELAFNGMVGIRRILPNQIVEKGSDEESTVDSTFEFCVLSLNFKPPLVRLTFGYMKEKYGEDYTSCTTTNDQTSSNNCAYEANEVVDDNDEYDKDSMIELTSVKVELMFFPPEFEFLQISPRFCKRQEDLDYEAAPSLKLQWEKWLQLQCNQILDSDKMSFSICEFVEHQALSYFYILHKDESLGYSALLFQDRDRYEYEHYDSSSSSNIIWKQSNEYSTLYDTDYQLSKAKKKKKKQGQVDMKHAQLTFHEYAIEAIQQEWKKQIDFQCPVCFDTIKCHDGVELPCRHFLCVVCAEGYIKSKLSDLQTYRYSPFICPIVKCRKGMKIKSGTYPITKEEKISIDAWKFNLNYPKSRVLSLCPRKSCKSTDMRYASTGGDVINKMVFCNKCGIAYCELCLKKYKKKDCSVKDHLAHLCDERLILKLCRRYKAAKNEIKSKAELKWHWLKDYASAREDDMTLKLWINENASRCPNCKTPIERIEGCFHMTCNCGTHFCYECGEEIFYPFYGTHHCWEEHNIYDYD